MSYLALAKKRGIGNEALFLRATTYIPTSHLHLPYIPSTPLHQKHSTPAQIVEI